MRRIEAYTLDRFNDSEIDRPASFEVTIDDSRQLDYEDFVGNTPAVTSAYDGYHDPQLVIASPDGSAAWDETAHYPVGRLAGFHGRSLELLAGRVLVTDQFDNQFRSLNVKGSDLSDPHFFKSATASRDFIVHGLQESLVMERVIRSSRLLRQAGVGTEYILGLALPTSFPVKPGESGIDDSADTPLANLLQHLATEFAEDEPAEGKSPLEVKQEMIERFKDCDYLVSYRALDTKYRFGDFEGSGAFDTVMEGLSGEINDPLAEEYLTSINPFSYMYTDFVPAFAANLAEMHNLGLSHGFLHANNISALGSIVDLDSCQGEALGLGDKPDKTRQGYDVYTGILSIKGVINNMHFSDNPYHNLLTKQDLSHYAICNFLIEYLAARTLPPAAKKKMLAMPIAVEAVRPGGDGTNTYRMVEMLGAVAQSQLFTRKIDKLSLPRVSRRDVQLRCHISFLNILPPALFEEKKAEWQEEQWKMNDKLKQNGFEDDDRPVLNPLHIYLKDTLLKLILLKKYQADKHRRPEDLLATSSALLGKGRPKNIQPRELRRAQAYMDRQFENMFAELSDTERLAIPPALDDILSGAIEHYRRYTGQIFPEGKRVARGVPIVYLRSDDEYMKVLEAFKVSDIDQCAVLSEGEEFKVINGRRPSMDDVVMFIDYRNAEQASEQIPKGKMFEALLRHRPGRKPMFMIAGYTTGNQKIIFGDSFETDESGHIGYYDVVKKLAPSFADKVEARLFDPVQLDTADD
jgi:hypothetical protein